jgi:hypothetical protein
MVGDTREKNSRASPRQVTSRAVGVRYAGGRDLEVSSWQGNRESTCDCGFRGEGGAFGG